MRQGDAMDTMQTRELISAMADGQLHGEAFARGVQAAATDAQAAAAWREYHVIGDVLRSSDLAPTRSATAFMAGLQARLATEAPLQPQRPALETMAPAAAVDVGRAPANESAGRWKMVAGFASLAAVAAIGWNLVGAPGSDVPAAGQLAGAAVPPAPGAIIAVSREGASGPMIRDPRLDQLMAAHRQFGGGVALQAPAGALRNATFESTPGR
jgi:sigma-E factor negative regulatory protein RseA